MSDQSNPAVLTTIIPRRKSCRTYSPRPVELEKKERISLYFSQLKIPPFDSKARFKVIDLGPDGPGRMTGTYGVIKGAKTFIAGAVQQNSMDLEDFGYLFEKIILFATSLGLDTCWIGATFNQSLFAKKMVLEADETLPVVSPLGYGAGRRSITDAMFHLTAGSKNRKPWSALFFEADSDAPLVPAEMDKLANAYEMVRLAPSAANKQPWRLIRDKNRVHFYMARTRSFERMFQTDLQRIDMGIAMCHFEIGATENGIQGKWKAEKPDAAFISDEWAYVVSWICDT